MKLKKNYFVIPLITIFVAVFGSSFMSTESKIWYDSLNQPSLSPPDYLFGIAWTIIYICTTISAIIFWNKAYNNGHGLFDKIKSLFTKNQRKNANWITVLFILNAILNSMWTAIFFGAQLIQLALVEIIILEVTIIALIMMLYKISKLSSVLLLPYLVWVSFATYLLYQISTLNLI